MTVAEPLPLRGSVRVGAIVLSSLATLSFVATTAFLIYTATIAILARSKHSSAEWAKQRSWFLATPFGILFINLMVADTIQAFAFVLDWVWVSRGSYTPFSPTCSAQAYLVQVGETSSSLANFLIALHTFIMLMPRIRSPNFSLPLVLTFFWVFQIILSIIGPIQHGWMREGGYWIWIGAWCGANPQFHVERLFVRYLWMILSAFGVLVLYLVLFVRLHLVSSRLSTDSSKGKGGKALPADGVGSLQRSAAKERARKLNRAGRYMIMYPLCFIICVAPLLAYRIASIAGHAWSLNVAWAAAAFYTLSGVIDVVLYTTTRRIIQIPDLKTFRRRRPSEVTEVRAIPGIGSTATYSVNVSVERDVVVEEGTEEDSADYFDSASKRPLYLYPPSPPATAHTGRPRVILATPPMTQSPHARGDTRGW